MKMILKIFQKRFFYRWFCLTASILFVCLFDFCLVQLYFCLKIANPVEIVGKKQNDCVFVSKRRFSLFDVYSRLLLLGAYFRRENVAAFVLCSIFCPLVKSVSLEFVPVKGFRYKRFYLNICFRISTQFFQFKSFYRLVCGLLPSPKANFLGISI